MFLQHDAAGRSNLGEINSWQDYLSPPKKRFAFSDITFAFSA